MVKGIQKQIDEVKSRDTHFVDDKAAHQTELDRINAQKKYLLNKIAEMRASKNEAKEEYYGRLVDYEI